MRFLINGEIGNYNHVSGKKYSFFAGNNYLGLSGHPDIKMAAKTQSTNMG